MRISPALIFEEIAKIGKPCLKVFFMSEKYQQLALITSV
jgi:hypothetical protein